MSGIAGVTVDVRDYSTYVAEQLKGFICMEGVTARGPINTPTVVGSYPEFKEAFGGFLSDYQFPYLVKRALDYGARVVVNRIAHYTDITDKTTLTAVKSSADLWDRSAEPAEAVLTGDVSLEAGKTFDVDHKVLSVKVDGVAKTVTFPEAAQTEAQILAAINAVLLTSAVATVDDDHFLVITGALPGYAHTLEVDQTASTASALLGMDDLDEVVHGAGKLTLRVTALNEGTWGDALKVTVTDGTYNPDTEFNVVLQSEDEPDLYEVYQNLTMATVEAAINGRSRMVTVENLDSDTVAPGNRPDADTTLLAGGADGLTGLSKLDYVGDETQELGYFAFDTIDYSIVMMAPEIAKLEDPDDVAYCIQEALTYCDVHRMRMMSFVCAVPPDLMAAQAMRDFRMGQGDYTHAVFNSWCGMMTSGSVVAPEPVEGQTEETYLNLGDVAGLIAASHQNQGEWFPAAGVYAGAMRNVLRLTPDFGSSGKKAQADLIADVGINPCLTVTGYGPCLWGMESLWLTTSRLQQMPTVWLVMVMKKALMQYGRGYCFRPINPTTWRLMYNELNPWMADLKKRFAFYDYDIQCDQFAATINDAVLHTPAVIERGELKCRLYIKPTVFAKWVGFEIVLTKTSARFQDFYEIAQL